MRFCIIFSMIFILSCDNKEEEKSPFKLEDATLKSLTTSIGTLQPEFSSKVFGYVLNIGSNDSIVTISAKASSEESSVKINDQESHHLGESSNTLLITLTESIVTITVTANDSISKLVYTVVITKFISSILEITGNWKGNDQFGDVTYTFSDAAWSTTRPGTTTFASGTISTYDNSANTLIFYIIAHTDFQQIGNYHRISWTPSSPSDSAGSTINLIVYEASSTAIGAANESGILISSHTLTKD